MTYQIVICTEQLFIPAHAPETWARHLGKRPESLRRMPRSYIDSMKMLHNYRAGLLFHVAAGFIDEIRDVLE